MSLPFAGPTSRAQQPLINSAAPDRLRRRYIGQTRVVLAECETGPYWARGSRPVPPATDLALPQGRQGSPEVTAERTHGPARPTEVPSLGLDAATPKVTSECSAERIPRRQEVSVVMHATRFRSVMITEPLEATRSFPQLPETTTRARGNRCTTTAATVVRQQSLPCTYWRCCRSLWLWRRARVRRPTAGHAETGKHVGQWQRGDQHRAAEQPERRGWAPPALGPPGSFQALAFAIG